MKSETYKQDQYVEALSFSLKSQFHGGVKFPVHVSYKPTKLGLPVDSRTSCHLTCTDTIIIFLLPFRLNRHVCRYHL